MKHLKRFYTADDADAFFGNFDESQSPGIIVACDEYPGMAQILHRPGTFTCVLIWDTGEILKTIQIPYDPDYNTIDLHDYLDTNYPEFTGESWEPYLNGEKINNWWDRSLEVLGVESGDTIEWHRLVPK